MVPRAQMSKRLADFAAACRAQRVKVTPQRTEILRELASTGEHPDAETVFKRVRRRIPAISLDTVYRTLHLLEDKGVIARVPATNDRARFDANMDRHHHFVCTVCGRISDFYSTALDGFVPPPAVRALGAVETVHVELRGRCRECRSKEPVAKHKPGNGQDGAGPSGTAKNGHCGNRRGNLRVARRGLARASGLKKNK